MIREVSRLTGGLRSQPNGRWGMHFDSAPILSFSSFSSCNLFTFAIHVTWVMASWASVYL